MRVYVLSLLVLFSWDVPRFESCFVSLSRVTFRYRGCSGCPSSLWIGFGSAVPLLVASCWAGARHLFSLWDAWSAVRRHFGPSLCTQTGRHHPVEVASLMSWSLALGRSSVSLFLFLAHLHSHSKLETSNRSAWAAYTVFHRENARTHAFERSIRFRLPPVVTGDGKATLHRGSRVRS